MAKMAKMAKAMVRTAKPTKRPSTPKRKKILKRPSSHIEERSKRLRSFLNYSGVKEDARTKKLKEKLKKKRDLVKKGDMAGRHKVLLEFEAAMASHDASNSTGVVYTSRGWGKALELETTAVPL